MVYAFDLKPGDLFTNAANWQQLNLSVYKKIGKSTYELTNESIYDKNARLMFVENLQNTLKNYVFYSLNHNAYVGFYSGNLDMLQKI